MFQNTPHSPNDLSSPERKTAKYVFLSGFVLSIVLFVSSGYMAFQSSKTARENNDAVSENHHLLLGYAALWNSLLNAESNERGYVITGDETYLESYTESVASLYEQLEKLKILAEGRPELEMQLEQTRLNVSSRIKELQAVIDLRRDEGPNAARNRILTQTGREEMDEVYAFVLSLQQQEVESRSEILNKVESSLRTSLATAVSAAALGIALTCIISVIISRSTAVRRNQQWLQNGQIGLASEISGDKNLEELGQNILKYLARYIGAEIGVFYTKDGQSLHCNASYGVPSDAKIPETLNPGDGLAAQVSTDGEPVYLENLPDHYLRVGSVLGNTSPREIAITPATSEGRVFAVLEFGFLSKPSSLVRQLLNDVSELIATSVRSANFRTELEALLIERQRQARELQTQSEELRVSNEELEEQSRALKESQTNLEQQQTELEQINQQLEEQTHELEIERDNLTRAQRDLATRTQDLARASQYKSDFLANMSHELRTPLNSSLILAKLLGDNPAGNLSEEQVKFARTIESSGNDLLMLINDILDLSKIEAGQLDISAMSLPLQWLASDLKDVFDPIAKKKELEFVIDIDAQCPKAISTDRKRLEQILKNLLSNAFKFTEKGKVALSIQPASDERVSLTVTDTGIGIPEENQAAIFEAFQQADGTISRKYGGTGLGLSISRELSRLLGGSIELHSVEGEGSSFTLYLPVNFEPNLAPESKSAGDLAEAILSSPQDQIPRIASESLAAETDGDGTPRFKTGRIPDDRDSLTGDSRVVLVVEDDESFAKILYDIACEQNFQCLIATTAEEALTITRQYAPHAVILDVGLPDNSGLSVLDRLKRDPKTRHIPVHVVSAGDYERTALSLGAAGYLLKPVQRQELENAFQGLEDRLSSSVRRVLLVEDDQVQSDSVASLLGTRNVETVAVGTAADCLEQLKHNTFDCMILDLSLPDASGYSILETLHESQDHSFPPAIVYTGKSLTEEDEHRLRRYSQSIIIKGAKSPERLLDEVTLFLHQIVSELPAEQRKMLETARHRDSVLEGQRILIVEDDIRNVYAITNIFEPLGAIVKIARNGREALEALADTEGKPQEKISLVLMDVMMPEMDGLTATRELRKQDQWKRLPIIMLTAKAMPDDQERCMQAGANDYMAKPIDVEKLVSLARVWMPR